MVLSNYSSLSGALGTEAEHFVPTLRFMQSRLDFSGRPVQYLVWILLKHRPAPCSYLTTVVRTDIRTYGSLVYANDLMRYIAPLKVGRSSTVRLGNISCRKRSPERVAEGSRMLRRRRFLQDQSKSVTYNIILS
jgi:hypothetical protein